MLVCASTARPYIAPFFGLCGSLPNPHPDEEGLELLGNNAVMYYDMEYHLPV